MGCSSSKLVGTSSSEPKEAVGIIGTTFCKPEKTIKLRVSEECDGGSVGIIYPVEIIEPTNFIPKYFDAKRNGIVLKAVEITNSSNVKSLKEEFEILSSFTAENVKHPSPDPSNEGFNHEGIVRTFFKPFKVLNLEDMVEFPGEELQEEGNTEYFCFLMERCDYTLENVIGLMNKDEIKISFQMKLIYILDIFESTFHLHQKKVIHRDLRPDNIMICRREVRDRFYYQPKVVDFGLATREYIGAFQSGGRVALFTAPEIVRNIGQCDYRVDVWSIGVTILLFLLEIPGRSKNLQDWKSKRDGKGLMDVDENYENRVKEYFIGRIKESRKKLNLMKKDDLALLRIELLDLILQRILVPYHQRISFSDAWVFVKKLQGECTRKSSLINPRSCTQILQRTQLFLYWNKCRTDPKFKGKVSFENYILKEPILFDAYFYAASHGDITFDMTYSNPLFHLMLEFGAGHAEHELHSSCTFDSLKSYFDVHPLRGWEMPMDRYYFIRDHAEVFCRNRDCLKKLVDCKSGIVKCGRFKDRVNGYCVFQYCSEKCKTLDARGHKKKCGLFSHNRDYLKSKYENEIQFEESMKRSRVISTIWGNHRLSKLESKLLYEYSSYVDGGYFVDLHDLSKIMGDLNGMHGKPDKIQQMALKAILNVFSLNIASVWEPQNKRKSRVLGQRQIKAMQIPGSMKERIFEVESKKMRYMEWLSQFKEYVIFNLKPFPIYKSGKQQEKTKNNEKGQSYTSARTNPDNLEVFLRRERKGYGEMEFVNIEDLKLNHICVNKKLILKVRSAGIDLVARHFVAEDSKGKYTRLMVYNISAEHRVKLRMGASIVCIHPYYKMTQSGEPSLRVDWSSRICVLPSLVNEIFGIQLETNYNLYISQGNDYYRKEEYWNSIACYDRAQDFLLDEYLSESDESIQCLRILNNKLLCFLMMKDKSGVKKMCNEFSDYWGGDSNLKISESKEFRKSKYLFVLGKIYSGKFDEGEKLVVEYKDKKFLNSSQQERLKHIRRQMDGRYDFSRILKGNPILVDYVGKMERRIRNGKYRWFASGDITKGEWLLVSRAEIRKLMKEEENVVKEISHNGVMSGNGLDMRTCIIDLLASNERYSKELFPEVTISDDSDNSVTIEKIDDLLYSCVFKCISVDWESSFSGNGSEDHVHGVSESLNFFFKSYFFRKHRDKNNSTMIVLNNALIVTAKRRIGKGEEIVLNSEGTENPMKMKKLGQLCVKRFIEFAVADGGLNLQEIESRFKDTLDFVKNNPCLCHEFLFLLSHHLGYLKRDLYRYPHDPSRLIMDVVRRYREDISVLLVEAFGITGGKVVYEMFMKEKFSTAFKGFKECKVCGRTDKLMKCSRCRSVRYCSRECQKKDWREHKKNCCRND